MMKHFSIKIKLTVLYSFFMILVAGVSIAILFSLTSHEILASVQNQLKNQVQDSVDDIEEDDGSLDIDSDFFSLEDNIYLSVYDADFHFLYGKLPQGFDEQPDFSDGELQTLKRADQTWYIFDLHYKIDDYGDIYIRGITSATQAERDFKLTLRFALILLPLLILVTMVIGYRMVNRTLRPVGRLTETVRKIQEDGDLSRRLGLAEGSHGYQDEFYNLAATFDQMLAKLEAAFQREKQFTSDVSHELRTPVSVILAQCSACLEDESLTDKQRDNLLLIERKTRQISGMISQLLLLSRADQNRQELSKEYLNLSELTEITALEQQLLASERNIHIQCEIEPDIYAQVDETFYIRMLINLLSNAICYGKDNGNILISLHLHSGYVTGNIQDDGIGISADDLPHIWERFYRADKSRTDGSHSGLGLSMVKWIVEAHGGRIEAASTPDVGTIFTFTLPTGSAKPLPGSDEKN